ncbi:hypothetical protein [Polymorphospora sp. NPDC050346]|uniref:hypothetical protein n=1 Tax=Polymorphospora sp. NPDC050346 TaxID=3155780 RepID=UPI003403C1B4
MRLRPLALAVALVAALAAVVPGTAEPARAATADRWGFALVDNPNVPAWTTLDTNRQWGSWKAGFPGWAQGGKLGAGRFQVRFPRVGSNSDGVVHVTPINSNGNYCTVLRWFQVGLDEIVEVQCFAPGGGHADTPFAVLWTASSGIAPPNTGTYAYLRSTAAAAVVQGYNSTGLPVDIGPMGNGGYRVKLAGVGSALGLAGNVQVTAVDEGGAPRRCKISDWYAFNVLDIAADVACHDSAGKPVDTAFSLSYHRQRAVFGSFTPPRYFGYYFPFVSQANYNNPGGGMGVNTIYTVAPGYYRVRYPLLALAQTHAQVVAMGAGSDYCHLAEPWSHLGPTAEVGVACYDNAGLPIDQRFLSTFTSKD